MSEMLDAVMSAPAAGRMEMNKDHAGKPLFEGYLMFRDLETMEAWVKTQVEMAGGKVHAGGLSETVDWLAIPSGGRVWFLRYGGAGMIRVRVV